MLNISALEKLVHELSRLPGVGRKSAQRLAYHILRSPKDYSSSLQRALKHVQESVHTCPTCYSFTDEELCWYCQDPQRDDSFVCVVEEPVDLSRIESSGVFRGRYHVLNGAISPLDGIAPEDLRIKELIQRIEAGNRGEKPAIKEVILALDADIEGDTTVLYLAKLLSHYSIRVTRIAHGVPIGSDIDYIDDRTMGRAIENRVEL